MPLSANDTTRNLVWQPEPNGRGSFSILSSCLLTLVLCVWTSVHPNVGFQRRPIFDWSHAESRTALLVIALGAPEYMIFFSWSQNYAARYLDREAGVKHTPFVSRMTSIVLNIFRRHSHMETISSSEVRMSCISSPTRTNSDLNPTLEACPFHYPTVDFDT